MVQPALSASVRHWLGRSGFITYFETARLDDFNNLVTGLLKVEENHHNKRFGDPLLLGTIRPLDEILGILSR
ncbi:MAG: hypothetical protein A4E19_20995 [Nitrospira sp. SG-bin1]|nr:MAG: hypothetical protein A4E19_20995 [Nitrospira sp. SG-bin1]